MFFLLYFGPSFLGWLFGSRPRIRISGHSCVNDRLVQHSADLESLNGHIKHKPVRTGDSNLLPYIGNGYFGLSVSDEAGEELFIAAPGQSRTLTVPVSFKPVIHVANSEYESHQSARVVNYVKGLIHDVKCYDDGVDGQNADIMYCLWGHTWPMGRC